MQDLPIAPPPARPRPGAPGQSKPACRPRPDITTPAMVRFADTVNDRA